MGTQTAREPSGARLATEAKTAARGDVSLAPTGHCDGPSGRGTCVSRPSVCPISYNSVCGCGGRTYSNECSASHGGVIPAAGRSPLTSSRITASVRSSRTCHAALPWIRPPSVLPAAGRSYRFSLPTAMGLERRRPRPGTPSLSVLAVSYLLRSVEDEKQPGALPTSR